MRIKAFSDYELRGLENRRGKLRNRSEVLVSSENVDITDSREIRTREGLSLQLPLAGITSSYFTNAQDALYIVSEGVLSRVYDDMTAEVVAAGIDGTNLHWEELGNRVGISGSTCGMIRKESNTFVSYPLTRTKQPTVRVSTGGGFKESLISVSAVEIQSGEQKPASVPVEVQVPEGGGLSISFTASDEASAFSIYATEPDGTVSYEIGSSIGSGSFVFDMSTPRGATRSPALNKANTLPAYDGPNAFIASAWYVSTHVSASNTSYIYYSAMFQFGLFNLLTDFIAVPGRITLMKSGKEAAIIGTTEGIWSLDGTNRLTKLSSNSVPDHASVVIDKDGTIWFWTSEGLAKAFPYEEVTAERLDPDSSTEVSLGLVEDRLGDKIIVVTKV